VKNSPRNLSDGDFKTVNKYYATRHTTISALCVLSLSVIARVSSRLARVINFYDHLIAPSRIVQELSNKLALTPSLPPPNDHGTSLAKTRHRAKTKNDEAEVDDQPNNAKIAFYPRVPARVYSRTNRGANKSRASSPRIRSSPTVKIRGTQNG